MQDKDPNAYLALQGKAGNRAGVGTMAVFGVAFTSLFRIVADLFMFAGMVMLRFLVMFFPAVAVLGVMAPMSAIVHRVANMAGASVVNVIAFAAGAAVHTTVVSALLSRSAGRHEPVGPGPVPRLDAGRVRAPLPAPVADQHRRHVCRRSWSPRLATRWATGEPVCHDQEGG